MKEFVLVFLALVIGMNCHAQFNDTTNYFINYASTGTINKTNDGSSYVLNNALRFTLYKKNFSINTFNSWIYGKQQHQLANNDFSSTLDFDLFKTDRHIYYWGLVNYEKSYSLKIDHRLQTGLGIGYYVIDRKNFVFQISDGILYEKNDLENAEGLANTGYETYRNSLRLKFRIIYVDILTLENIDFLQHSLTDRKDYIIKSTTTLSVKLVKWLSVTVALNYNKLNVTHRENLLLNYGITVSRYF
ncbi:MAG TPA: DUF481 domain-containing protein [Ohtaekwangia sp.]|nr:DUF481 domain-containing protein [Ohtaekwangia sp.]